MLKAFVIAGLFSVVSVGAMAQSSEQEISQFGKTVLVLKNQNNLQELPYSIDRLSLKAVVRGDNKIEEIIFVAKDFENYENCSFNNMNDEGSCDLYRCEADVRLTFGHFGSTTVKTENIRDCKFVAYVRN